MMLLSISAGVSAQSKAGVSLKEMNTGKTQKIKLDRVKTGSVILDAEVEIPLSWKNIVQGNVHSPYGNGEASVAILVSVGGKTTLTEMFKHDSSDVDYFKSNIIGEVFHVEKYYAKDSMRVVRIDTRRPEYGIYYTMYYAENEKGHLITMSCIIPDKTNAAPRTALKKYIPVFDAILSTVDIQETIRHIEKDTLSVCLNEYFARIKTYKGESKMSKGNVAEVMYTDSTRCFYFMMDAKNIASAMDSAVVNEQVRARLAATVLEIQKMEINTMTLSDFTNSNNLNVFLGVGTLVENNKTKPYMLGLVPYKNILLGVKMVIEDAINLASYMENMMFTLKNVHIKEMTLPAIVPQADTLAIKIDGDTTRMLYVPLKKGWRGEKDGRTKNTFIHMTQGENMGVVPVAYKYEDYTDPARQAALCKSLEKSQESSSVRYKRNGDYDVFEIFNAKKGNPLPQKNDMHIFLLYGKGIRINVWYFCPVNSDVERVSKNFEEMLKTWEVK